MGELASGHSAWYAHGLQYWERVEPTVEGVLGGFGQVHHTDVKSVVGFLQQLDISYNRAIDCGGGIGRMTEAVFLPRFTHVCLLEPAAQLMAAAKTRLAGRRGVSFKQIGIQDFKAGEEKYDVIF